MMKTLTVLGVIAALTSVSHAAFTANFTVSGTPTVNMGVGGAIKANGGTLTGGTTAAASSHTQLSWLYMGPQRYAPVCSFAPSVFVNLTDVAGHTRDSFDVQVEFRITSTVSSSLSVLNYTYFQFPEVYCNARSSGSGANVEAKIPDQLTVDYFSGSIAASPSPVEKTLRLTLTVTKDPAGVYRTSTVEFSPRPTLTTLLTSTAGAYVQVDVDTLATSSISVKSVKELS